MTESLSEEHSPALAGKKVVVAGYFGFGNAGDEAILEVTVGDLRESLADVEIVVVSGDPAATTKAHSVKAVSHLEISEIISEIETCDLIILGGGGLFHDYWGIDTEGLFTRSHSGIAYYTLFPLLAALLDKPLFLNAIGVGPLFSPISEQYTRMAFEYATAATVRDAESRELLASIGFNGARVRTTADPAFRFTPARPARARAILESKGLRPEGQFLIGVSLRKWEIDVKMDAWSREVARALDRMVERFDARIVFVPFQSQDFELTDDAQVSETVYSRMLHQQNAILLESECTPEDKAAVLAQCQLVLGMRLHSIIFAANARVPAVAMVYDPKVRHTMKQLGCEQFALDLGTLDENTLFKAMESAVAERGSLIRNLETAGQRLSALAIENSVLAIDVLRSNGHRPRELSPDAVRFLNQNLVELIKRNDEGEHVAVALQEQLRRIEGETLRQKDEIEIKDRIIAARDEGIEWVRGQLAVTEEEYRKLSVTNESLQSRLTEELAEQERVIEGLSMKISDLDEIAEATAVSLNKRQLELDRLTAQLQEERDLSRGVVSRLADLGNALLEANSQTDEALKLIERRTIDQERSLQGLEQMVERLIERDAERERAREIERHDQLRDAEIEVQKEIVRARDEGIAWLRGEVANYQRISEALASANRIINEELAERDMQVQVLKEAVRTVELELLGLTISRGWRLLNQFRKVRRWIRTLTGRPSPKPVSTRPTLLVDRREPEMPSNLTPLLEEIRNRLAGLAGAQTIVAAESQVEVAAAPRARIRLLPTPHEEELRAALDERAVPERQGRPDVICFSVIDWQFRYQRPQQVMSQFAAHGHRVFYISTTRFTPPGSSPRVTVKSIKENVIEVELCSVHQPDVYGEVIGGINWNELEASLEELRSRFSIDEAISYVMIASWTQLAQMTKERWGWRIIYDCMDEWDRFPGIQPAIVEAEKQLVESCDLLVVSSRCLQDKWAAVGNKLRLARNAVDYDFYLSRFGPNHLLSSTKRPIVGYFGAIADWFDLELLASVADKRPEYTFVLLGGIFGVDVTNLVNKPNVKFLGQQPYELMPKYLYQFDACMIPFKINAITEATDPVKLYEYLSCGKPVVSVDLPELAPYREHVYIAESAEEFASLLDRAVDDKDSARSENRRNLARSNDWKDRYQTIMRGLSEQTRRASIIIVTYNNLEMTRLCLESVILNTEHPNYEVIVVDNRSEDGTPAYLQFMAERFPNIRIILNDANEGFAKANNQAIAISTGEDIVLLNNDTVVPPGWLTRLVRHLRHNEVGLVGPVSNFVGNEARIDAPYATWEEMVSFARQHTYTYDGQGADIHMLAMFCVAMRRDVWAEIGPLDEQFGLGMFEDDDYAHRVRLKGYRVICAADVFVHHFGQASFKKLIQTGEYDAIFERNLKAFESKWNVKWSARSNVPLEFRSDYAG